MNDKLLRKVQKHILAEPKRLDMDTWFDKHADDPPPCGTVACIAGWSVVLGDKIHANTNICRKAARLLHIEGNSNKLFLRTNWPIKFNDQYDCAKTAQGRARATSRRIDYFIKTGE